MATRKEIADEREHKGFRLGAFVGAGSHARKEIVEHRKHKRYQVPRGAFVGFGSDANKVGQIVDLSLGGLAFRYVGSGESFDGSHLDIFMADNDFYLGSIPFETVSDFEIIHHAPYSPMTMRRSGVRFGKLTHKQRSKLEYFIQHHALGEA